ncbi:hypothetical protein I6A60_13970 [Frankia sp. AgB1.9]|uniref:hypothetical protein n=1 Tax=unclassified Frankia TaxID=2632575 RepID=UPI00193475CD|nr:MULTISPECIES: hypothetical protein [unclassified Frankia]MBL7492283.1 hypothetical protein [Frankia sp. AgW1.1]MBL7548977.1 hypothetical protein [Frankia sp. AgB1.9]MBL7622573.1 hypothetical protein [Frankia sp. AgB1.8]
MSRAPWRVILTGVVLTGAVAAGCLTACAAPSSPSSTPLDSRREGTTMLPTARRNPADGPIRSDLDPLLRRFPALGRPTAAHWESGTYGDDRVPGPSTYWIDAVVALDPDTAATLRKAPGLAPATLPALSPQLVGQVPTGASWLTSQGLRQTLAKGSWSCEAFLSATTDVLVLRCTGDR